jgi:hypothetical protein
LFPSSGEELSGRECDEGCEILLSWLESIVNLGSLSIWFLLLNEW